jgi:hypothetical protein
MTAAINPVQVEHQIMDVLNRISAGIGARSDAYEAWLEADADYDKAHAIAYTTAVGPAHKLKALAELATMPERRARDQADAVYKRAERNAKALETELSALQSILKSILASYGAAGVGER